MSPDTSPALAADSALAAALFAVDPAGLGGVALRAAAGPDRDAWLALMRSLLPGDAPWRRIPININDTALLGGLDLGATLQAGRPVAQQGVLAQADGGVVLLAMAERLSGGAAARLAAVLDSQEVVIERDGLALRRAARLGVVALDEGAADDEQMPAALLDRMAFHLRLAGALSRVEADARKGARPGVGADSPVTAQPCDAPVNWRRHDVEEARALLPGVAASDAILQALCAAALALGIASLRAPLLALRVARAAAALSGMEEVDESHAAIAARLVLAPRATQVPLMQAEEESREEQPPDQPPPDSPPEPPPDAQQEPPPADDASATPPEPAQEPPPDEQADADDAANQKELAEAVLEAARAAIPPGLLAALKLSEESRSRTQAAGRAGAAQKGQARGRPVGARRGEPRAGARLNIIETLRAAAPWQRLRRQQALAAGKAAAITAVSSSTAAPARITAMLHPGTGMGTRDPAALRQRIHVRREDFHVTRMRQLGQTTTVFVVDASGSSALHRLAEAKGAVELLLADCYVRRDRVSVLAFRGKSAELLLPPTRSLARAKRSLAALPGGGGTPLAAAIDAAVGLAGQIQRRGETPIIVLLTDGRGNIARNGAPGRVQATEDALASARQLSMAGLTALLLDTSPQPQPAAQLLAATMGAAYVPLPYAGAQTMAKVVSQVGRMGSAAGPH